MSVTSTGEHISDEELAESVSRREHSRIEWDAAKTSFEQLYARHAEKLLGFLAARVLRSDLDDVHQAVWERVWQHLPARFRGGNFRAWLHQIARNHLIDRSRKKQTDALDTTRQFSDPRSQRPEELLIERERMLVLQKCLEKLDTGMADLVRARLTGESYEEICRRLDLKAERAHKVFHKAKSLLSECFERSMK